VKTTSQTHKEKKKERERERETQIDKTKHGTGEVKAEVTEI